MTIETAVFAVQRGDKQFSCVGSELNDKTVAGDLFAIQRGDKTSKGTSDQVQDTDLLACTDVDSITYKVTGTQFKSLFNSIPSWQDPLKPVWHIKNLAKVASPDSDELRHLFVGAAYVTHMEVYSPNASDPNKNLADLNNPDDPESVLHFFDGTENGYVDEVTDFLDAIHAEFPDYPDEIELVELDAGKEYYIVSSHPLFLSDNMSWDFGELTNTTPVTHMEYTLIGAREFNGDVSEFDMQNVVSIYGLLPTKFNNPSLVNWDTRSMKVIANQFEGNRVFNQDIGGWDMRRVIDIHGMFLSAWAFNQDIGDWQFEDINRDSGLNGHPMDMMLINAKAFNQDISRWCVENISIGPNAGSLSWMQGANPDFVANTAFHPKWGQPCP